MEDNEFNHLTPEEKHKRFQNAVDNYNNGYIEEDYVLKSVVSVRVEDAMEDAGRMFEEFKPGQMNIIYEAAKEDVNLDYFMNPKFSVSHMKFILEQLLAGKDVTWLPVGKFHENIVIKPLTRAKIANIRKRMETAETKESVIADLMEKKKEIMKVPRKQEKSKQRGDR